MNNIAQGKKEILSGICQAGDLGIAAALLACIISVSQLGAQTIRNQLSHLGRPPGLISAHLSQATQNRLSAFVMHQQ
jgi:hypothetical protein